MKDEYTREVRVEIGGEERRVLLCLYGLMLAEQKGYDISEIELDEEAEQRKGNVGQMLDLLWIGMLPFNEDLSKKELGMQIGFGDLEKLEEPFQEMIDKQITDDVREKIEEAQSGEGAEGKAQAT